MRAAGEHLKIYVGHASSIDSEENLYKILKNSSLADKHDLTFPHKKSKEPFDSKSFLSEDADLFVAETSKPSTGLGIELGWAEIYGVPVVCIHRSTVEPSSSLKVVAENVVPYDGREELVEAVSNAAEDQKASD
nr:MAG: hypothetical protein J07AB56_05930 [Candidatus Nanosalinarum sp. J07AB56]